MPPSGTTGKSSSKTGARGPTGPSGEARSSPAGNKGGAPGATSRTSSSGMKSGPGSTGGSKTPGGSSGSRGGSSGNSSVSNMRSGPGSTGGSKTPASKPTTSGTMKSGPGSTGGPTVAKQKSGFERFSERYPGGVEDMPVVAIPPPVPGGFGPAGAAIGSTVANAQRYVGNLLGAAKNTAAAQKRAADMAQVAANIDKARKAEAAALGKTINTNKIKYRMPEQSLAQARAARDTPLVERALNRVDDAIDYTTSRAGLGTGPRARAEFSGAMGAGTQIASDITTPRSRNNPSEPRVTSGGKTDFGGYRGGGLAKSRRSYKIK